MTQPTASAQIKALESALGVALFDRSGKRMLRDTLLQRVKGV